MDNRIFTRVWEGYDYFDRSVEGAFENHFLEADGQFVWENFGRNARKYKEFVEDITEFDFKLKVGEIKRYLAPNSERMLMIGTSLGTAVIHQRYHYERITVREGDLSSIPIMVRIYVPEVLRALLGDKPIREEQLYRYTGFHNSGDNLGNSVEKLRKALHPMHSPQYREVDAVDY